MDATQICPSAVVVSSRLIKSQVARPIDNQFIRPVYLQIIHLDNSSYPLIIKVDARNGESFAEGGLSFQLFHCVASRGALPAYGGFGCCNDSRLPDSTVSRQSWRTASVTSRTVTTVIQDGAASCAAFGGS